MEVSGNEIWKEKLNVLEIKQGELNRFDPLTETIDCNLIEDFEAREAAETVGYYAMFEYINGFRKAIYWSKEKMLSHADKYSPAFSKDAYQMLQEGKKMLAHVKPRKIEGRIKFGTEDPCLTGEILGAAGIFYPLYGENFSIEPCFDQTVLEGTISLKGRMYGIVLLISAVKILRSRDIRYIIRHFN